MEKREKDSVTADGWGLLKMERYYLKKEQRVFMVEQYFKNNEGFSKSSSAMRFIFMMDWLLDEIVVLGVQKIHKWSLRNKRRCLVLWILRRRQTILLRKCGW